MSKPVLNACAIAICVKAWRKTASNGKRSASMNGYAPGIWSWRGVGHSASGLWMPRAMRMPFKPISGDWYSMSLEPEIEQALASLRQSLASGRLAHAYLIVGAPQGGAGVLAERVVALLYCTAPGERPCGQCAKCRQITAHAHPDVLWVEPQKKSRGILMAQIKAVQEIGR